MSLNGWKAFNPLNWVHKPKEIRARTHASFSYPLMKFLSSSWPEHDALIEVLLPKGGATLVFGPPKNLKSWFGLALCLDAANPNHLVFGKFQTLRPLRSILVAAEDLPTEIVKRLSFLLKSEMGLGCDPELIQIVPRCPFNVSDATWRRNLEAAIASHQADFVVLDVLRRMFRGDVNSSKDTAEFLEILDAVRDRHRCAIVLIHHSRKGAGEVQTGALGSINITAWADVLVQVKNKFTETGRTTAEVEIESKIAESPDPLRLVLDFHEPSPLFVEGLGDSRIVEAETNLASQWTSKDLADILEVSGRHARRIIKGWMLAGRVHKLSGGRHGLGRYAFCSNQSALGVGPDGQKAPF